MPQKLSTKLKYVYYGNLDSGGGTGAVAQAFRLNSVYDPDRTGVGNQPRGFDQMAAFYGRYRVDRCSGSIQYTLSSKTTFPSIPVGMTLNATNVDGSPATFLDAAEASMLLAEPAYMLPAINGAAPAQGTPSTRKLKFSIACHTVSGVTQAQYKSDDHYQALVTTNPSEILMLVVGLYDSQSKAETFYGTVLAQITYHVTFFDPKEIGAS